MDVNERLTKALQSSLPKFPNHETKILDAEESKFYQFGFRLWFVLVSKQPWEVTEKFIGSVHGCHITCKPYFNNIFVESPDGGGLLRYT
jgi:hypothetical protein